MGPDGWAPASIRYVNVGKASVPVPGYGFVTIHFDLEVTARSTYTPFNSSLNGLNGRFAQINLAANHEVDLRATVKQSCSTADSCNVCSSLPTFAERVDCFASGCSCVGVPVSSMGACEAADKEAYRMAYNCSVAATTLVLPPTVRAGALLCGTRRAFARCPARDSAAARARPSHFAWAPARMAGDGRHVGLRL